MLAFATVFEKVTGSHEVYSAWWFTAVWIVLAATGSAWAVCSRIWRRRSVTVLHAAFLLILIGALLTRFTGRSGYVHLREGESADVCIVPAQDGELELPFTLRLLRFDIEYYEGTRTPRDYVSRVEIDGRPETISMNRIARNGPYRLCQLSYDPDMRGTTLSLSRDPYGITVTYAGYLLLAVAMILSLAERDGSFRKLLRSAKIRGTGLALLVFLPMNADAKERLAPPVDIDRAAELLILHHDRIATFETFALETAAAVTGRYSWDGYSAMEIVCGWIYAPDKWQYAPMIKVDDRRVREVLGVGRRAAFIDFFDDDRNYRITRVLDDDRYKEDRKLRQALMRLNDKLELIVRMQIGDALAMQPVRDGHGVEWHSLSIAGLDDRQIDSLFRRQLEVLGSDAPAHGRIRAERLFNRVNRTAPLSYALMTAGIAAFASMCMAMARRRPMRGKKLCMAVLAVAEVFLTILVVLHSVVAGHPPMSNGYETMLFIAWIIIAASLATGRRHAVMLPFGLLFAGFALLVATLSGMSPQISPLMPVLHSAWLCCHVSLMMASYALLGFIAVNGMMMWIVVLLSRDDPMQRVTDMAAYGRLLLYPALFLLTAGIFTGAVWANVSWGSYWAWDPKETWALITMILYAVPLHSRLGGALHWQSYLSFAFASVLMTYFGVNVFFGGMHSYGHTAVSMEAVAGMCTAVAVFAGLYWAAAKRCRRFGKED